MSGSKRQLKARRLGRPGGEEESRKEKGRTAENSRSLRERAGEMLVVLTV